MCCILWALCCKLHTCMSYACYVLSVSLCIWSWAVLQIMSSVVYYELCVVYIACMRYVLYMNSVLYISLYQLCVVCYELLYFVYYELCVVYFQMARCRSRLEWYGATAVSTIHAIHSYKSLTTVLQAHNHLIRIYLGKSTRVIVPLHHINTRDIVLSNVRHGHVSTIRNLNSLATRDID